MFYCVFFVSALVFLGIPNVQNNDSATALVLGSPPFPNEVIQSDTPGFQVFKTLDSHWGQMGPGMIIIHKPEPSGDVLPHPFLLLVAQPRSISRAQTLDTTWVRPVRHKGWVRTLRPVQSLHTLPGSRRYSHFPADPPMPFRRWSQGMVASWQNSGCPSMTGVQKRSKTLLKRAGNQEMQINTFKPHHPWPLPQTNGESDCAIESPSIALSQGPNKWKIWKDHSGTLLDKEF